MNFAKRHPHQHRQALRHIFKNAKIVIDESAPVDRGHHVIQQWLILDRRCVGGRIRRAVLRNRTAQCPLLRRCCRINRRNRPYDTIEQVPGNQTEVAQGVLANRPILVMG